MSQYSVGLIALKQNEAAARIVYEVAVSGYAGSPGWAQGDTLDGSNSSTWRVVQTYGGGATGIARIARLTGNLLTAGMTLTKSGGASATVSNAPAKEADWLTNVQVTSVGPLFSPGVSNWFAYVTAVDAAGDILTLDRNWMLASLWDIDYIVHSGFTPVWGVPLIGQGDFRTAALVNRAHSELDRITARMTKVVSSSPYTVVRADQAYVLLLNASSSMTINLPTPASVGNGWWFRLMPTTNTAGVTVNRGSALINGAASNLSITAGTTYAAGARTFFTDGTNWFYVNA